MSNYFDMVTCPNCGVAFMGAFIDRTHVFNHTLSESCPQCSKHVINVQYLDYINSIEKVVK